MADYKVDLAVLGSGPGGYTAAFRAADLGLNVLLIERYPNIGGVCLNVGCIPSKALLHVAKVMDETDAMQKHGVNFGKGEVDLDKLRGWKDGVIGRLTGGLRALAKQRKVTILEGVGSFVNDHVIAVTGSEGEKTVEFSNAIIAAGSSPIHLPFLPDDERIIDSTGALKLEDIPEKLLVIGGGIIGLEMATVYRALGSEITVVEMMPALMGGAVDPDILNPLTKIIKKQYENIYLETKVTAVEAKPDGLYATFEGKNAPEAPVRFDKVLSSVGRTPNGKQIKAELAGVHVDERGFIPVDNQMRTNVPHIFAIGDIVGNPMLAHKAVPEGRVAAEVIAGKKHYFDPKCIPNVAYTDPEIAWVGVTEKEAKESKLNYGVGAFPWAASGRAIAMNRTEGLTKVLFDNESNRIIGAAIVGPHAGDLISEAGLAIEMGCDAEDISLTIHPHPTLGESFMMATEAFEGTITDLYMPKKEKAS